MYANYNNMINLANAALCQQNQPNSSLQADLNNNHIAYANANVVSDGHQAWVLNSYMHLFNAILNKN